MTDEKALTVQEQHAILAEMDLGIAGEENLQRGDIGMPPRLRISQRNRPIKVGDGEAPAGSIVNTLTGEVFEQGLEIVPLVFLPRTRVLWPEVFSADNSPECASDDGEYPAASSDVRALIQARPGPCTGCELGRFGEDGTPPRCKMQRNFLVWLVEQSEPAILTMQSTALAPARQFTTLAKTQGLRKSIRFATRNVESDQGNWHVPAFSKGRKLILDEVVALAEARDELRNLVITADVAEEMRENGGEDAPPEEPEELPF
jgi:hypothetical protein